MSWLLSILHPTEDSDPPVGQLELEDHDISAANVGQNLGWLTEENATPPLMP
jgi:hypothetical protein